MAEQGNAPVQPYRDVSPSPYARRYGHGHSDSTDNLVSGAMQHARNASRGAYIAHFWGMCFGALCNAIVAFGLISFVHWGVPALWGLHVSNRAQAFAASALAKLDVRFGY